MNYRVVEVIDKLLGRLWIFEVEVIEGDESRVFHGTAIEIWAEDLVVTGERMRDTKELLKEFHRLITNYEYARSEFLQVIHLRFSSP